MYKISTSKTVALLLANKNIKSQSKIDFLNTLRPINSGTKNIHQQPRKSIKKLLLHLTDSKTTILCQNQARKPPFKHPKNINNNFKT